MERFTMNKYKLMLLLLAGIVGSEVMVSPVFAMHEAAAQPGLTEEEHKADAGEQPESFPLKGNSDVKANAGESKSIWGRNADRVARVVSYVPKAGPWVQESLTYHTASPFTDELVLDEQVAVIDEDATLRDVADDGNNAPNNALKNIGLHLLMKKDQSGKLVPIGFASKGNGEPVYAVEKVGSVNNSHKVGGEVYPFVEPISGDASTFSHGSVLYTTKKGALVHHASERKVATKTVKGKDSKDVSVAVNYKGGLLYEGQDNDDERGRYYDAGNKEVAITKAEVDQLPAVDAVLRPKTAVTLTNLLGLGLITGAYKLVTSLYDKIFGDDEDPDNDPDNDPDDMDSDEDEQTTKPAKPASQQPSVPQKQQESRVQQAAPVRPQQQPQQPVVAKAEEVTAKPVVAPAAVAVTPQQPTTVQPVQPVQQVQQPIAAQPTTAFNRGAAFNRGTWQQAQINNRFGGQPQQVRRYGVHPATTPAPATARGGFTRPSTTAYYRAR